MTDDPIDSDRSAGQYDSLVMHSEEMKDWLAEVDQILHESDGPLDDVNREKLLAALDAVVSNAETAQEHVQNFERIDRERESEGEQ